VTRTATCACGDAQVTVHGDPTLHGICHCRNCRQRTGTAFGWQAYWPAKAVTVAGALAGYDLAPEWGQRRQFCSRCGSTLLWATSGRPGEFGVAVGGLDPPLPPPPHSYRDSNRYGWVVLPLDCVAIG